MSDKLLFHWSFLQPNTLYDLRRANEDGVQSIDGKPGGISMNDESAVTPRTSNRRSEVCYFCLS